LTVVHRSCPLNRNNAALSITVASQSPVSASNSSTNIQSVLQLNTAPSESNLPQRPPADSVDQRNQRQRIIESNNAHGSPRNTTVARHNAGAMNVECPNCYSMMWSKEKSGGTNANPLFSICCNKGKVNLPPLPHTNNGFARLLKDQSPMSREFKSRIISYNSALSFTSTGRTLDESVANNRHGAYCYRIQGQFYHMIGSLYPHENNIQPQYAQIYIYDSEAQLDQRMNQRGYLNQELLRQLQNYLLEHNPYASEFQHMHEVLQQNPDHQDLLLYFRAETETPDRRRYNAPRVDEVAVLLLESPPNASSRDIIVRPRNQNRTIDRISEMNRHYDPMHYVLIFPEGDNGWHINIRMGVEPQVEGIQEHEHAENNIAGDATTTNVPTASNADDVAESNAGVDVNGDDEQNDEQTEQVVMQRQSRDSVTVMMFYSYRLMYRVNENNQNCLHLYGRLFQKYIVDNYAKLEMNRLNYIRLNQGTLRSELYNRISDTIRPDDTSMESVGRLTVLPSSFIGGPRHYTQLYQDALDMCRRLHGPHFFVTFTCNPTWPEITNELLYGQTANDRPDLVDRVFYIKLKEFLNDLTKRHVLGRCIGYVGVVEYQKR
jgi:hypothetical protein